MTHVTNPAAQCWGKHAYQTPQLAATVARRMERRLVLISAQIDRLAERSTPTNEARKG